MRRWYVLLAVFLVASISMGGVALADGPSGSTQCHLQDDDCDGTIDEDTGGVADDSDADGLIDEDPVGDANGDGDPDDDGDGLVDEDVPDDDGDGLIDEDPVGDAADDPGENQVDCNEASSTDAGGVGYVYVGTDGAEVCADDTSAAPIDGSATVDAEEGYVAADGDNSNPAPANGYARIDSSGVHCGDENNQDASADQTQNTSSDCG
jgi:hypothetical protein